jgi:hypothetical protein
VIETDTSVDGSVALYEALRPVATEELEADLDLAISAIRKSEAFLENPDSGEMITAEESAALMRVSDWMLELLDTGCL